jgi:hypothetical protein
MSNFHDHMPYLAKMLLKFPHGFGVLLIFISYVFLVFYNAFSITLKTKSRQHVFNIRAFFRYVRLSQVPVSIFRVLIPVGSLSPSK